MSDGASPVSARTGGSAAADAVDVSGVSDVSGGSGGSGVSAGRPPTGRVWPVPELQALAAGLLRVTAASRVTVRLATAVSETELLAEALAPDVVSMRGGVQPAITTAPTYEYLARERRMLIQPDTRVAPLPPASLVEQYGVLAQMLAPVLWAGAMAGTVSVHQQGRTRAWDDADVAALADVGEQVTGWYTLERAALMRRAT